MKRLLLILAAVSLLFACKKGGDDSIKYDVVTLGAEVAGSNITLSGKLGPDLDEAEVTSVGFFVSEDKAVPESGSKDFAATLKSKFEKKITVADLDGKTATTFYYRAYAKGSKTWLGKVKAFATEKIAVTKVTLDKTVLGMTVNESVTVKATVTPANASRPDVSWSTSDAKVAKVSDAGVVTGVAKGKCVITAVADGVKATCDVTVRGACPAGAVDMGTSVFWAEKNLGASAPDEVGDYFCWGETAPKQEYTAATYNGACDRYGLGEVLKPADDAARAILKGNWRMPTKDEFLELIAACDIEFSSIVPRSKEILTFTSKATRKTLIFRISYGVGMKYDKDVYWSEGFGMYWTATNHSSSARAPYHAQLKSGKYYVDDTSVAPVGKHYGLQIRAVID